MQSPFTNTKPVMHNFQNTRRHDIDCLRVLAFITLIFYHIGMFYVSDWGWHVKSSYQSHSLQYLMLLVNPWRMALIFFISGFALCMVEPKITWLNLVKIRLLRVLIPLFIGIHLIVPPQVYFEAMANFSYSDNYWSFWLEYLDTSTTLLPQMHVSSEGLLTWNHLWYLAYLFSYTLVYLCLKPLFNLVGNWLAQKNLSALSMVMIPILILTVCNLWLKPLYPKTNALVGDWYNHAVYFSVFVIGYLAAKFERYLETIKKHRKIFFMTACTTYLLLMVLFKGHWPSLNDVLPEALFQFVISANTWLWILAVVGYAAQYLNKPSPLLSYLNEAILPWYILHQTVIIVLAVSLNSYSLGAGLEASLVIIGTFSCCAFLYELIKRWRVTRFVFGMKLGGA